jgi:hypothetical protein
MVEAVLLVTVLLFTAYLVGAASVHQVQAWLETTIVGGL